MSYEYGFNPFLNPEQLQAIEASALALSALEACVRPHIPKPGEIDSFGIRRDQHMAGEAYYTVEGPDQSADVLYVRCDFRPQADRKFMQLGERFPDSVPANLAELPVSLRGVVAERRDKDDATEKTYLIFQIEHGLPGLPEAAVVAAQTEEMYRDFVPIDPVVRKMQEQRLKELGLVELSEEAGDPLFGKIDDQDVMWQWGSRPVGLPKLLDCHEARRLTDTIFNIQFNGKLETSDGE